MKAALVLAFIASGLAASAQTSKTTKTDARQPVSITTAVPCANRGKGEIVTFTGNLKILSYQTTEADGTQSGVYEMYVGDLVGKGATTDRVYKAVGSYDESYKETVFVPNGDDGDFTFTIDLHVTGKYEHFLYHDVREFIVFNQGNSLTVVPEVTACE